MELPTLEVLNETLNDLLASPDGPDKTAAVAKVRKQISYITEHGEPGANLARVTANGDAAA
jgi:hypothetical protein